MRFAMPPEKLARAVVKAVKRNKFLLVLTPEAHFFYKLKRLFPGLYYRLGPVLGRGLDYLKEDS